MLDRLLKKSPEILSEIKYIELPDKSVNFSRLYTAILEKNEAMLKFCVGAYFHLPEENDESPITLLAKENKLTEIEFFKQFLLKKKINWSQTQIDNDKLCGLIQGGHILTVPPLNDASFDRCKAFGAAAKVGNFSLIDLELQKSGNWISPDEVSTIIKNATANGYQLQSEKYCQMGINCANAVVVPFIINKEYARATSGIHSIYGAAQTNNHDLVFSLLKKLSSEFLESAIYWSIYTAYSHGHFTLCDQIIDYGNKLPLEQKATMNLKGFNFSVAAIPPHLSSVESDIAYKIMLNNKLTSKELLCWMQPEIQSLFALIQQYPIKLPRELGFLIGSYVGELPYYIFTEKELNGLYDKMGNEIEKLSLYFKKNIPRIIQHEYQHSGIFIKEKLYLKLLNYSKNAITAYTLENLLDKQIPHKINNSHDFFIKKLKYWIVSVNPALLKLLNEFNDSEVTALFLALSIEVLQSDSKLTACCETFFHKKMLSKNFTVNATFRTKLC